MFSLSGYTIIGKIYQGNKSLIYRGIRYRDSLPVILKLPIAEYPTPLEIEQLKFEYEIYQKIHSSGIPKLYDLENYRNSPVLVMEDIGGESLKKIIKTRPLDLFTSLKMAVKLSDTLAEIHQNRIIHKNINPNNIVINLTTEELRIIDFGSSTFLSRENPYEITITGLEGSLPYISPEQTGRMNRALDYRTDLYSLGVTFYEMFSGVLPFKSDDLLELVYCHIAVNPTPLRNLKRGFPESISNIVLKLMAKDAQKRYQNCAGLKSDLLFCLKQLESGKDHAAFEIGKNDFSDQFRIPQKLYGREQEIAILLDSFRRVVGGPNELVLVTGLAGVGKSSLVNEIRKPVIQNRGFFIAGKFDPNQRNIPYSVFIDAIKDLIRQILSESEENIRIWRERILKAVGECGQIIIDLIPEIKLIIGQQPALPELNPVEAQNRLNLIFLLFVKAFCLEGRPLVIFLDDLHWADLSSLKMMGLLLTDNELKGMLLISAYRDQEFDPAHPLPLMVKTIEKTATRVVQLTLKPLEPDCVNQLLEETLNCKPEQAQPLATLCVQKTGGNPYFLGQFLNTLYRDKFIRFNPTGGIWQWDLNKIEGAGVTDNVVDMMIGRIQALSSQTQEVIKLASCIGNTFDLKTLSIISEKAPETVRDELWEALVNELVLPVGDSYKYTGGIDNSKVIYKFTHDRVQQAAYLLIDDSDKKAVHFKIGQLMLRNLPEPEKIEKIFEIVNHFGICKESLSGKESSQFAELYLIAGEKAKVTKAYELASYYFQQGINLLEADGWRKEYELTRNLHMKGMEAAYLSFDFKAMDGLMEIILAHTEGVLDQVEVYRFKIQRLITQNNLIEAIDTARSALHLLGVTLPQKAGMFHVFWEYLKVFPLLLGKKVEKLADLRLMSNPDKLAAMNIISIVANSLYFTDTILVMIITLKQIGLTIRYGNAPASSYAYTAFGVFMNILGNVNLGYQLSKLAQLITEKYNFTQYKVKVLFMGCYLLRPWKESFKEILNSTLQGYYSGLENGDFDSASFCAQSYIEYSLLTGANLNTLQKEIATFYHSIRRFRQETALIFIRIIWQTVINISLPSENKMVLNGAVYGEDQMLPAHIREQNQSAILILYYHKCLLAFLFEEYDQTIEYLEKLEKFSLKLKTNFLAGITFHFYNSLARLAVFQDIDKFNQTKYLWKINSSIRKMRKWSRNFSANFSAKLLLMEAEQARVFGKDLKAMKYYQKAIALADENGNLFEMALAHELAAKFYFARDMAPVAAVYLKNAHQYYLKWGAANKTADLERRYPEILAPPANVSEKTDAGYPISMTRTLDSASIIKATQALSGEIVLEKLLRKLIEIVLETAGAQKAVLIIPQGEQWGIGAIGNMHNISVTAQTSIPMEQSTEIPFAVIHYVQRTKESVILDDAATSERFATDTYIVSRRPKSILCAPIIHKGDIKGLLYLENNSLTGAFTGERIEILTILASQVAISIENASLYGNLDELVQDRTRELSDALENLKKTQNQLIDSEKMAALGQLVAGIAHEINTPLGAIQSSITNISDLLPQALNKLPDLFQSLSNDHQVIFLALLERSLQNRLKFSSRDERTLKKTLINELEQYRIVDSAPIADILVDMGIYNDLTPLLPLFQHDQHLMIVQTAYHLSSALRNSRNIKLATEQVSKMVVALGRYARYDHSGEMSKAEITAGIETVLMIYHNQMKLAVELIWNASPVPPIMCYPDELNQVWTNLIKNALQAMDYKGKLEISVYEENEWVVVKITDSGKGIPEEIREKIFDPFFTTKPQGEGTGLGLDIVNKIIRKHHGEISVESQPGRTTFTVKLPQNQENPSTPFVKGGIEHAKGANSATCCRIDEGFTK